MATCSVYISSITASEVIAGQEWSRLQMNACAGNLVPASLCVPVVSYLSVRHCSGRPTVKDHSLAIFKGCPMGYHCHCQALSNSTSSHQGRLLKLTLIYGLKSCHKTEVICP